MTDSQQLGINLPNSQPIDTVEGYQFEPIKGYPMLHWRGKRPFTSTQYYPAQLKEVHGSEVDGWRSKIYWGDNLQVMSHLLKEFRGKVNLVYIDPPFDSKADYKTRIQIKGGRKIASEYNAFEEKQYTDIWNNDEYLQFIFERLILVRELMTENGSLFIHCDERKSHFIRCILEELFGSENIISQIFWKRRTGMVNQTQRFGNCMDIIYWVAKSNQYLYYRQYTRHDSEKYTEEKFDRQDENGRRYRLTGLTNPGYRPTLKYEYKGYAPPENGWSVGLTRMEELEKQGKLHFPEDKSKRPMRKDFLDEWPGYQVQNLWTDIVQINPMSNERLDYPTQKPETVLERIINASSNPGDIVFDCFMGSGTTQAVAMKLGRRFIGADINLGAVQISTKRLLKVAEELEKEQSQPAKVVQLPIPQATPTLRPISGGKDTQMPRRAAEAGAIYSTAEEAESDFEQEQEPVTPDATTYYTGFEVYNVNHYDVFRNPLEAKDLLLEVLEVNRLEQGNLFDGEKDGRMVKMMPVNRIATRADLNELIAGFDYKAFEKRYQEHPHAAVEKITLVCMGHEPDLAAQLKKELKPFELDVEVVDILRDKQEIQFKRDSEASIVVKGKELAIEAFYPMNLLGKLSLQQENVEDWRELVESVMIDWNYDGAIFQPLQVDIPDKNELVSGRYPIPDDAGTIRVKITDLLSESLEVEIQTE